MHFSPRNGPVPRQCKGPEVGTALCLPGRTRGPVWLKVIKGRVERDELGEMGNRDIGSY